MNDPIDPVGTDDRAGTGATRDASPGVTGYDVVVVGGGIAGLVAGAYAARGGARTLVAEGHALGGRSRTARVAASDGSGDFTFNQGAHAVYDAGELREALDDLGVVVTGGAPSDLDVWHHGRSHVMPVGPATMLRSTALSPRAKAAAVKLFGILPLLRPSKLVGTTVDEWIRDLRLPADTEALARALVRIATYSIATDRLDAGAVLLQLQRALRGVTYLDGGWQTIVDGLRSAAERAGAVVETHTAVRSLVPAGDAGDAAGTADWTVHLGGEREVRAAAVVLACGGPAPMARLLGIEPAALGDPGPSVRAACLDIGLASAPARGALFSLDEPLYLSRHMGPATLGPDGAGVVCLLRNLGADEHLTTDEAQHQLWEHAGRFGIHESGPDVLAHRYLHDMTVTHGMPLAATGGLAGRPSVDPALAGLRGVYLAGDWVGAEGMLGDASAASARTAASLAVAHAATTSERTRTRDRQPGTASETHIGVAVGAIVEDVPA